MGRASVAMLRRYQRAIAPVLDNAARRERSDDEILAVEEQMLRERMAIELHTIESTLSPNQWHVVTMVSTRSGIIPTRDTPVPLLRRFVDHLEAEVYGSDPGTEAPLL